MDRVAPFGRELQQVLTSCAAQLARTPPGRTAHSIQPQEAKAEEFRARLSEIRRELAQLNRRLGKEFQERFAELRRSNDLVTIVFFGRTRAGKSTTLEALADGDGSSIGVGRQHTTRKRTDYLWPCDGEPLLRLVDTPGVEGFRGEALARMAEEYVDIADHVFFVLTADKATAGELDRLGNIRTAGKPVTVLLNVKEKELDLVLDAPELVFDAKQLAEYKARINEYLERHFDVTAPQTIVYHAHAAFESNRAQSTERQRRLQQASGILDVEKALKYFLSHGALKAKLSAPRDLISSYVISVRQMLQQLATDCEALQNAVTDQESTLNRIFREMNQRALSLLEDLSVPYHTVNDKIPELVDDLIAAGKSARQLNKKWQSLLRSEGVESAAQHFVDSTCALLRAELEEASRIQAFDAHLDTTVEDGIFSKVDAIDDKEGSRRLLRAGVRTAGGLAAGLGAYALYNFWNPSGWLAAVGWLGVTAATYGGEVLTQRATDSWAASSRRDIQNHRSGIIKTLRDELWTHHRTQKQRCQTWLHRSFEQLREDVSVKKRGNYEDCVVLQELAVSVLGRLNKLEHAIQCDYLAHCIELTLGKQKGTKLRVERSVRNLGSGIKAVVSIRNSQHGSVTGLVGADRVQALSTLLEEPVALVTAGRSLAQQVAEALYPAHVLSDWVKVQKKRVVVAVPATERAHAMGQQGKNVRLASELVGSEIFIVRAGPSTAPKAEGGIHVHR